MYKIIALLGLLLPSIIQAQDLSSKVKPSLKNRMTVEQARIKCANLSPEKKVRFAKICAKVENISKKAQIKEKYPFVSLRSGVDYYFTDYEVKEKSSGAGATLVSKNHVGLNFKLVQHFSPKFKTYLGFGYQNIYFENTLSKPLVNPNLNLVDFNGGIIYNPSSRLTFDLGLHYGDVYYVRPYSNSELKFTKQLVPSAQLQVGYDLFSYGNLDFGIKGQLGYTPQFRSEDRDEVLGNFKAKSSLNYGGEIYARKQFDQWSVSGGIGLSKKQMETNYMDGELTQVNFGIKIAIPFGWNEGK